MFVFRKISRALFSWNTRFEFLPFALLPTTRSNWKYIRHSYGGPRRHRNLWCTLKVDLKISLSDLVHIKMMPWKFRILHLNISRVIHPWSSYFSYKVGYFLTYSIFSDVCKQTFRKLYGQIDQEFLGLRI